MTTFKNSYYIVGTYSMANLHVSTWDKSNIRHVHEIEDAETGYEDVYKFLAIMAAEGAVPHSVPHKLFCSCGYQGDAIEVHNMTGHKNQVFGVRAFEDDGVNENYDHTVEEEVKWDEFDMERQAVCPACGKDDHQVKSVADMKDFKITLYAKLYKEEHKTSISFAIQEMYYNTKVNKLGQKIHRARITFSYKTKQFYYIRNGRVRNMSHMALGSKDMSLLHHLFWDARTAKDSPEGLLFQAFEEEIATRTNTYLPEAHTKDRYWSNRFPNLMSYVVCPQLTLLPDMPNRYVIKETVKALRKAPMKKIEVYRAMFGPITKAMIPYLQGIDEASAVALCSQLLKDNNYVLTLLKESYEEKRQPEWSTLGNYKETVERLVGQGYTKGFIKWMHEIHKDERDMYVCIRRSSIRDVMGFKDGEYGPTGETYFRVMQGLYIFKDTYNMLLEIRRHIPDYEFAYDGHILTTHDLIMKDYQRVQSRPKTIPYSADEQRLLAGTYNGYDFVLPENTLDLVDCGNALNICVGSYGNRAVDKGLIIVFVMKDNKYAACIELDREGRLQQVKGPHNNNRGPLSNDVINAVAEWCIQAGINGETYDLNVHQPRLTKEYPALYKKASIRMELGNPEDSVGLDYFVEAEAREVAEGVIQEGVPADPFEVDLPWEPAQQGVTVEVPAARPVAPLAFAGGPHNEDDLPF